MLTSLFIFAISIQYAISGHINITDSLVLNTQQRHERLLNIKHRHSDTTGQFRYKQSKSNHKLGSTKLSKPISNLLTNALHVNQAPKKRFRQLLDNSSEIKSPKPVSKFPKIKKNHRPTVHSSRTDKSKNPSSRLFLILDQELENVRSSREMTRTTLAPNIFRLRFPMNITHSADNHHKMHSRLIVDVDDETEASGFNELEELDKNVVPFQPRQNHNWHLRTDEYSKFQLLVPSIKELHRGENQI